MLHILHVIQIIEVLLYIEALHVKALYFKANCMDFFLNKRPFRETCDYSYNYLQLIVLDVSYFISYFTRCIILIAWGCATLNITDKIEQFNNLPYLSLMSPVTNVPHLTNSDVDLHMPADQNFNYYK